MEHREQITSFFFSESGSHLGNLVLWVLRDCRRAASVPASRDKGHSSKLQQSLGAEDQEGVVWAVYQQM